MPRGPVSGQRGRVSRSIHHVFHVHDTKRVDHRHSDPSAVMADPTKAETEQVFKILKAQKGNKVSLQANYQQQTLTVHVGLF